MKEINKQIKKEQVKEEVKEEMKEEVKEADKKTKRKKKEINYPNKCSHYKRNHNGYLMCNKCYDLSR